MRLMTQFTALGMLLGATSNANAQAIPYELHATSDFISGCFDPCDCPLKLHPDLTGLFELEFLNSTPNFFDNYLVRNVSWVVQQGNTQLVVTGSGEYSIGGSLALTQRMTLDLSINGAAPVSFDSGFVLGGQSFPAIDIDIAMNDFFCFDQVFAINTAPLSIGSTYCVINPNTVGPGACIRALGSDVVQDNDFSLVALGAPPQTFGIFFYGTNATQTPLGEGFLCATGSIRRLQPVLQSDPAGNRLRRIDLTDPSVSGDLQPGNTRYFQYWYRDPGGGPVGFNLSDGVCVSFQ